jgi:hypothetical protein
MRPIIKSIGYNKIVHSNATMREPCDNYIIEKKNYNIETFVFSNFYKQIQNIDIFLLKLN